jgi:hypothetical protein
MKQITVFVISFFLFLFSGLIYGQNTDSGWKAGVAKVKITPEQNMWLAGYAARTKQSDGIIHDLWAKALFIEDAAGNQALLITNDLLGFTKAISDQVRDRLQSELGLSRAQIILNSSHTHSGPVLTDALKDIYPLDEIQKERIEKYSRWLVDEISDVAGKAKRSMKPADIYAENGVVRFQVNRRNNPESKIAELTELNGPNDFAVPVLKIENKKGKTEAIVFGYACHPTVLNGYQWSGDYPGFAQLELENRYKGAIALFFQGAGADQNPMPRRSAPLAKQYGLELAAAVERVLSEDMRKLQPTISTAYAEVDLELNEPPTKEELIQLKSELEGWQKTWAENMQEKLNGETPLLTSYPFPVQVWKVGDQNIVSLGGELLVNYSNNLKKILGNDLFVMGYSNDVMGYIPGERVLAEGGYEGETSQMVYGLPAKWKTGIERKIIERTVEVAEEAGIMLNDESKKALDKMFEKNAVEDSQNKKQLTAKAYFSGFDLAHDTYNAISSASDGKIYYVLSSQEIDVGGQVYVYDPATDQTRWLADLTEICGEKNMKAISQGKSHVRFIESDGKLYFATHVGFYEMIDGMERLPVNAPDGYKLYPGGHFLSYDLSENTFENLAIAPDGEGILTMTMDTEKKQIYAITWPKGYFIHYDLVNNTLTNLGLVSENGEAGQVGDDYRVLCRSMFVDSRDGKVYYSTAGGDIFSYDPAKQAIKKVEGVDLRLDYFGKYDYTGPGSMAYNWRAIVWEPNENVAYGVHGNSGYLFRFDPKKPKIEIVERITSEPSQKSGMFDQFSYGYLGFDLGPDKETLYYLTGGPIYIDGKRVKGVDEIAMGAARGLENLHLVTYHIPTNKYTDHGPVFYTDGERPTYVNSIAIDKNGNVYTLARFEHKGKLIQDLVKIPNPFKAK